MQQRELSRLDLSPRHLDILLGLLRQHVPGAEVWAYGSRVAGGAHEGSDLDLVLRNARSATEPVSGLPDLQSALQDSSLPMLVEVHGWPDLPASFQENIKRCYVVLRKPEVACV